MLLCVLVTACADISNHELSLNGAPLTACTLGERKARCVPIANPWVKP